MILPPIVSEEFGGGGAASGSLLYCIALFYAMKMMAHVIQQKVSARGWGRWWRFAR